MTLYQPSEAARQRLELSSGDMSETLCGHQVKCVGEDTSAVIVPPGNFIPLSVDEILEACLDAFPSADQKQNFQRFYALMEAIVHFEFHDLCKAIIYNYRLFGNTVESVRMRSLLSDADLQKREQDFIKQFCGLMCMANFNLLSDKEYKIAKAEDFLFTLPVDMDWKCLDDKLLTKFLDNHPELAAHVPNDFTNRILIFHRGIEEAVVKDKFISEKVEMIVDKVVFSPFRFVWRLVGGKKSKPEVQETSPSEDLGVSHEHTRVIHRKTLDRMLPSVFTLLTKIISKIEIQEPAFSNVVVVYRHSLAGENKINKNGTNDEKQQRAKAIYIKMFRHIPMADMEVTFPFKSLSFKPSSVVSLAVTCVLSILAVYNALQKGKKGGSQTFALTVIVLLVVRCVQLYKSMQAAKKAMEDDITRTLFNKTQDNDEGVVYYLLTSTEQQELKEILLAYAFLLAAGGADRAVEIETLDKSIEKALHDKYKIGCDFEIDDAVRKLINHKLASKDQDGKLRVKPFDEALKVLDNKWDNYFNY